MNGLTKYRDIRRDIYDIEMKAKYIKFAKNFDRTLFHPGAPSAWGQWGQLTPQLLKIVS